jgi:post-segregation antitoxin (ccd killing protein)
MQTTYRLNTQELNMSFLMSLKNIFDNQEIEVNVKTVKDVNLEKSNRKQAMLDWVKRNRESATVIDSSIDLRTLIDQTHDREI